MDCPKCDGRTLSATSIGKVEVDKCRSCGGVWCDHNELIDLLAENRGRLAKLIGAREHDDLNRQPARCPRDGAGLIRVCSASDPSVVLDSCPQCQGIWLDGGELDKLIKK